MATPHIESKEEDIAKIVLMPGDSLRAKYIAEHFLEDARLINTVRNTFVFTGKYKGHDITVFSSGMGILSMGIYSYELFKFYNVDTIIRIGSAGAYTDDLKIYDVVLVESSYSDSTFAKAQNGEERNVLNSSEEINQKLIESSNKLGISLKPRRVHCSDVFYKENDNFEEIKEQYGCSAVEMETFSLFHNANALHKKASALVTISDSLVTHEETTSEERQNKFNDMIKIALDAVINL